MIFIVNANTSRQKESGMKATMKWVLPIGAALSLFALLGVAFFYRLWMGQRFFPAGYDMMRGGSHHLFAMPEASNGWLIFGAVLLIVVLGIIFVASRSQAQPGAEVQREPLDKCPACDADLVPAWKHCPYCGYDLS
jgi:hypothetical protein